MRVEFELTDEEFAELHDASRPVRYMVFGGYAPRTPQENALDAWTRLGRKRGFKPMTVQPGRSQKHFTAEPADAEDAR